MELFVGGVFVWARRCSEIRLAPFTTTELRTRRRTEERPVMATFIIDELTWWAELTILLIKEGLDKGLSHNHLRAHTIQGISKR
jgi:hypothetical protein